MVRLWRLVPCYKSRQGKAPDSIACTSAPAAAAAAAAEIGITGTRLSTSSSSPATRLDLQAAGGNWNGMHRCFGGRYTFRQALAAAKAATAKCLSMPNDVSCYFVLFSFCFVFCFFLGGFILEILLFLFIQLFSLSAVISVSAGVVL